MRPYAPPSSDGRRPTARRFLFGGSSELLRNSGVTADLVRRPGIRTQISDTRARQFAGETSSVRLNLRLSSTASLSGWPYLRAYRSSLWYDSASADSKLRHEPQLRSYPLYRYGLGRYLSPRARKTLLCRSGKHHLDRTEAPRVESQSCCWRYNRGRPYHRPACRRRWQHCKSVSEGGNTLPPDRTEPSERSDLRIAVALS